MAMASLKRKEAELVYDPLSDFSLLSRMKKIKSMDDELLLMLEGRGGEEEEQTFPSHSLLGGKELLQHLQPQYFVQIASGLLPEIQSQDEWHEETKGDAQPMDHKSAAISSHLQLSIHDMEDETGTRNEFIDDLMEVDGKAEAEAEAEFNGAKHPAARIYWTGLF